MAKYDAIVVGARCAGSPTAMLLARKGLKVGPFDKSRFPSDMPMSTHLVQAKALASLQRWGLLDRVTATNCPPIREYDWDFGHFSLRSSPRAFEGISEARAPRR